MGRPSAPLPVAPSTSPPSGVQAAHQVSGETLGGDQPHAAVAQADEDAADARGDWPAGGRRWRSARRQVGLTWNFDAGPVIWAASRRTPGSTPSTRVRPYGQML